MPNWKEYKLADVASVQTGPFGSQLHMKDYVKIGTPIITVEHLGDNRITHQNLPRVTKEDKERLKKYWLQEGDVVFSRVGSVDRRAYVTSKEDGWLFSGRCLRVRADEVKANGLFLSYYFGQESFREHIRRIAVGATMPSINTTILSEIKLTIPDISTQIEIAEILSSLDDKIELNNQINKELEALAQALFKHWFIDFEFPNENGQPYKSSGGKMVDSELGEIPKGWISETLNKVIEVKHGYAYRGEDFSDEETTDILVTPGNFKIGGGFNYNKFKYYKGECPEEYVLRRGDLIVTMTDLSKEGDTLGYSALVPSINGKRLHHNQRIGKILYKKSPNLKYYLYLLMRTAEYRAFVLSGASGTTVKHTSPSRICEFKTIIPNDEVLERFNQAISELDNLENNNNLESDYLTSLRNLLLPKLISGELEVTEAITEKVM